MNNVAIKIKDKEHQEKVIKYFEDLGFKHETNNDYIDNYIGVYKNMLAGFTEYAIKVMDIKIIELPEYPKVMLVWNNKDSVPTERVVFMEKCGKYLAWLMSKTLKEAENETESYTWNYAKDLPIKKTKEVTISELKEMFNVDEIIIKNE